MEEWHGCRTDERRPRERYVWSEQLREANRLVQLLPEPEPDPFRRFGFGSFRLWVLK